jgi:UDP-N-acetylmuramate dehydrogenase
MTPELAAAIETLRSGPLAARTQLDAPIGALTTYRVGGTAAALVTLDAPGDPAALATAITGRTVDVVAIGRGSNLLVSDDGFEGIAVLLGPVFADITIDSDAHTATCGAAAKLPIVARATVQAGLTGFEWAVGVPGSIGGAVRMNAGGHGAEMKDTVVDATVLDLRTGELEVRGPADLAFGYRSSGISGTDLVLEVRLRLAPGDPASGKAELAAIVQWRRDNQPGGQNAGSVFTNPVDDSAGRLIDLAGLKGLRIGSAEVSEKHANFIQADPDGRAEDVRALMREVVRRVFAHSGVTLEPETHLVGFDEMVVHDGD